MLWEKYTGHSDERLLIKNSWDNTVSSSLIWLTSSNFNTVTQRVIIQTVTLRREACRVAYCTAVISDTEWENQGKNLCSCFYNKGWGQECFQVNPRTLRTWNVSWRGSQLISFAYIVFLAFTVMIVAAQVFLGSSTVLIWYLVQRARSVLSGNCLRKYRIKVTNDLNKDDANRHAKMKGGLGGGGDSPGLRHPQRTAGS